MSYTNTARNTAQEQPLDDSLLGFCKASADQLRLAILQVLSHDSYSVFELCRIFDHKQSGMSHHLKILAQAGLVSTRREGNSIFYRRTASAAEPWLEPLQQALFACCEQQPLSPTALTGVAAVQQERERRSQAFFAAMGDTLQQQQEQIVDSSVYLNACAELLRKSLPQPAAAVLEIGPGEGGFLAVLSPCFNTVYALDTSPEMRAKARALADQQQLRNIVFLQDEAEATSLPALDCIVANMVLHHVASPALLIAQQAQRLRPGGLLCITDLCSHDQNWARQACGDLWLGFDPIDLEHWAQAAGLREHKSTYLAQRNGFQVQVRQFIKP